MIPYFAHLSSLHCLEQQASHIGILDSVQYGSHLCYRFTRGLKQRFRISQISRGMKESPNSGKFLFSPRAVRYIHRDARGT